MSASYTSDDKEKAIVDNETDVIDTNAPDDSIIVDRFAKYGKLGPVMQRIFASGVEARGVERVPEDQRENKHVWNKSVNCVLTTIPIGVLAQEIFTLTLPHAIATIFCFGAIGASATAFIATLGPQTGLRTMIITRFSSGYAGGTIYSILNILTQLGFSVTAVILGGQTLASINPGTLPLVVGIIIVAICSLIPCFIGYSLVHVYERYAWIIVSIIMLFLWGLGGHAGFDINAQKPLEDRGRSLSADVMSFGGIVFGSFTGVLGTVAADYNCRLPVNTSSTKVFLLTFFGLFIPICFVEILGAALMTITDPAYTDAFENGSTGGGKFILRSITTQRKQHPKHLLRGLSMQALGRPFAMIPRFFWVFLAFVIYTVAGVAGREHFSAILSNFLSILSYWTAFFIVIVAEEHFIFRRKNGRLGGYNLDDWDTPGSCLWAGGAFGTDLGFELAAGFAAVAFPPLRWLEIKLTGR
ncbi:cytosine-purine permease [Irpex lacteus]|nr:cytosine-purine permease [Irpex lacteus]